MNKIISKLNPLRWLKRFGSFIITFMSNGWEQIISWLSNGRRFKTNILTPIAWGGFLVVPASFYGLLTSGSIILQFFFGILITGFSWFYIRQYLYWREKDPDRLQSEWFVSEKIKAEMRTQGGVPELIESREIANPPRELPEGGGDE